LVFRWKISRIASAAAAFALVITTGATIFYVARGFVQHADSLVKFGEHTRAIARSRGWPLAAVSGRDEGMLLYLELPKFTPLVEAQSAWRDGNLSALVLPEKIWRDNGLLFPHAREWFKSEPAPEKNSRYVFI